jgi:hypothetical protein
VEWFRRKAEAGASRPVQAGAARNESGVGGENLEGESEVSGEEAKTFSRKNEFADSRRQKLGIITNYAIQICCN